MESNRTFIIHMWVVVRHFCGTKVKPSVTVRVKYQGDIYHKKTLTLVVTFEWFLIQLSYYTCVFPAARSFCSAKMKVICQGQGQIAGDTFSQENLRLAITFEW